MRIEANFGALKRSKWYEYVVRFLFGGTVLLRRKALINSGNRLDANVFRPTSRSTLALIG